MLLLVEGLPGSGKTTTSQRLWLQQEGLGRRARWWFEHELEHPIVEYERVRAARQAGAAAGRGLFEEALGRWAALAGRLREDDETVILESSFLQTTLGSLLLLDLPPEEITDYYGRLGAIIAPLDPRLIRLRRPAVAAAVAQACTLRPGWFASMLEGEFASTPRGRRLGRSDLAAITDYFLDRESFADRLTARFPGRALVHDNSDCDWPRQMEAIGRFLGWPPAPERKPAAGAAAYLGRYRAESGDELTVTEEAGGLRVTGEATARLLPLGGDDFVIESLCVELSFRRGAGGRAAAIDCRGALPGLPPRWRRMEDEAQ